ncbi:hypothetical protein AGMMS49940_07550 [Spirochaetia bacterium]|nr:hypothetical protein AGMMS49940_07550 [Spirochaetia bacterium]
MPSFPTTLFIILTLSICAASCTFDYGDDISTLDDTPDIIMEDVEYVRVRDGDPVVRFQAQLAERYETRQTMELRDFSFEQFYDHGKGINATGKAGSALVELETGNIQLGTDISIAVDSEDITIETDKLSWQDKQRVLSGNETDTVNITRSDGTLFSGQGFTAEVRSRTWNFSGKVGGVFVDTDDDADQRSEEETAGEIE